MVWEGSDEQYQIGGYLNGLFYGLDVMPLAVLQWNTSIKKCDIDHGEGVHCAICEILIKKFLAIVLKLPSLAEVDIWQLCG